MILFGLVEEGGAGPVIFKKYELCSELQVPRGHAVVQLVEALHYTLEGRWFDSRWCHWNFSLT